MTPGQERQLFDVVARDPDNVAARVVYADWLEQAGDRRAAFVRQHLETAPLPPDHPDRAAGEQALSRHRVGLDPAWLAVIEPERRRHYMAGDPPCDCFARQPP